MEQVAATASGFYRKSDGKYRVDDDVLDSLLDAVVHRISDETARDVCHCFFEAWRDIIKTAVENTPGEDSIYVDLFEPFLCIRRVMITAR